MGSIRFCPCTASQNQSKQNLFPMVTTTKIKTPFKSNAVTFTLKSSPARSTQVSNHTGKCWEPVSSSSTTPEFPLKIGIIGFGNFGQFIGEAFKKQGHTVIATSRSDYSEYCEKNGFEFFRDIDGFCEEQPDIVLLSSSILSTENIVRNIPFHKLKHGTMFADVLSVKQFPRNLFLEVLPREFGILCTHPMFGPNTAKDSWEGSRFVYEKVRITEKNNQEKRCGQFLSIFRDEGCQMVEMPCEEHDKYAAGSQFVTHTIGRILSDMNLKSTPIDTKGYERLLELTNIYSSHHYDLYYGLFAYNVHAREQIDNLEKAFDTVKQKLFGRLRDSVRKQMEMVSIEYNPGEANPTTYFRPINKQANKDQSSFAIAQDEPPSTRQGVHVAK